MTVGEWNPIQTPWCPEHWAHFGGSPRHTLALLGEFGIYLRRHGLDKHLISDPGRFRQYVHKHAPICCRLDDRTLYRIKEYGDTPPSTPPVDE